MDVSRTQKEYDLSDVWNIEVWFIEGTMYNATWI